MLVGAEPERDEFTLAMEQRLVAEGRTWFGSVDRDEMLSRGVPDAWLESCWLRTATSWVDGPPEDLEQVVMFGVGGQRARRSVEEIREAVQLGFGLDLVLPNDFDLTGLADVFRDVRYLLIAGHGNLTGWEALDDAHQLRDLLLSLEPSRPLAPNV